MQSHISFLLNSQKAVRAGNTRVNIYSTQTDMHLAVPNHLGAFHLWVRDSAVPLLT